MNLDTRLERAIAELGEHVDADGVLEEVRRRVSSRHRKAVASRVLMVAFALTVAAGGAYAVTRAIGPRASTTGGGASAAQDTIVLVQTVPNLGAYTDSEIYVMNIQTKTTRKLVSRSVRAVATGTADDEPAWSPDGKQIAFVNGTPGGLGANAGDGDIFVMNADGTNARQVTSGARDAYPAWSPDGKQIAFVRDQGKALVIVNSDGSDIRVILSGSNIGGPSWGPRGIVFSWAADGTGQLHSIQPDGTGLTQLTSGFDDSGPAWSPDGSQLAFSRSDPKDPVGPSQLFVMNADGTGLRQVTFCQPSACVGDGSPAWSPDGTELAFTRQGDGGNSVEVYVVGVDGAGLRQLTEGPSWWSSPAWQP